MILLTEEQYNILNQQRAAFEELEAHQAVKGLTRQWLQAMAKVHTDVFKVNPCITCGATTIAAMNRLFRKMKEYEAETNIGEPGPKNKGRKTNNKGGGGGAES